MAEAPAPARTSGGLEQQPAGRRAATVAVVGMSAGATSGMRDHAVLLAEALEQRGTACSLHWLARGERGLLRERAEVGAWTRALGEELARARPDAVLLHYASFGYSHRGVPIHLRPTLAAVRRARAPMLAFMHELTYPWSRRELRANVWALTQRLALAAIVRASDSVVVTMDRRERWLASRRWLARRPLACAPVFSNLPAARAVAPEPGLLGLFGYAYAGVRLELVLDALGLLRGGGVAARLVLLGSPGEDSPHSRRWRAAADERGLGALLRFSGVLPAQELADAIAGCEVLLSAAWQGPTSSRGSLAASLASGRPLVALDGPRTWAELGEQGAARLVEPNASALARALGEVLADGELRASLQARGRAFYESRMSLAHSAELTALALGELCRGAA